MDSNIIIIIAEDDEGHAALIKKNLRRNGISNHMLHFKDGQETLDFLLRNGKDKEPLNSSDTSYILLLDIRMPKVDGIEVLRQVKQDPLLHKIPVIIVTTTDDPREINNCYRLGCSNYITKPVEYDKFVEVIKNLGLFLLDMQVQN